MKAKNYQASILADVTAMDAYEGIKDVKGWWAKQVEGKTQKAGDIFTVRFGKTFVEFGITEDVPGKRIVWSVRDCYLHWIKDKKEWNGMKIVFEITPATDGTKVMMTHVGLAPGVECYEDCEAGWNEHFGESLLSFLTTHEGMPV